MVRIRDSPQHNPRTDRGTVLSHIISQLRPGADLSRVVLPTFILEPRSMLERITKYVQTLGPGALAFLTVKSANLNVLY